jgi:hypothetical protein
MRQFFVVFPTALVQARLGPSGIPQTVSAELSAAFSPTPATPFNPAHLARAFPLPWSHYVLLINRSRSAEALAFYHTESLRGGWSALSFLI